MKIVLRSAIAVIYISSFLNIFLTTTFAQAPEIQWMKTFGDSLDDRGYSVKHTTDGGYIVVGSIGSYLYGVSDLWLIKTDSNGDTLWTKTFGDNGCVADEGYSVQQTTDGGYIITGVTNMSCGNNGSWNSGEAWLIKTNADGDSLWSKDFKKSLHGNDWGNSVQQTTDGGYIFTGVSGRDLGVECGFYCQVGDVWLVRTDSSGDTIWTKSFGDSGDREHGNSVWQTNDGGFIITGSMQYDVLLIKTDANGDTTWTKKYSDSGGSSGYSVQQTNDDGYIIVGSKLIKTDMNGDTLWTKTYGGYSVQQTSDGGYIIVGQYSNKELWLIKTNANGDTLWTKITEGFGRSVQQTSDGGYIITGIKDNDVLLIKVAPDITSIGENQHASVNIFQLKQNYPNPFNPSTKIDFILLKSEFTTLKVYNILGREVSTPVSKKLNQGDHSYTFDGKNLASGVYYYRIEAGKFAQTRKMIYLK